MFQVLGHQHAHVCQNLVLCHSAQLAADQCMSERMRVHRTCTHARKQKAPLLMAASILSRPYLSAHTCFKNCFVSRKRTCIDQDHKRHRSYRPGCYAFNTHTHTHAHTCMHASTHATHMHTHTLTCIFICINTRTSMHYIIVHPYMCMHTQSHIFAHGTSAWHSAWQ